MQRAAEHSVPTRFVDPAVLARIGSLELVARTVVEGFVSGLHRSPHLGLSTDFAEHRPYLPGDDIRRIDWRVFGRTDRFYVKEFEADTNTSVVVLLDVSRSMAFGSGGLSKLDYGRYLAACLAWFSAGQRDRIGFVAFDDDVRDFVPPSTRHLPHVLHAIDRLEPGGAGRLEPPLRKIGEQFRRRSLLVVVSDFYEAPDAVLRALDHLRNRGNELIAFHLVDPAERTFPFEDPSGFQDMETGERLPIVPEKLRAQYQAAVAAHHAELAERFGEHAVDYLRIETSEPLEQALFAYLAQRQAGAGGVGRRRQASRVR